MAHLHLPAQVMGGVRRRLAVRVLIRDPVDAVASYLVYSYNVSPAPAAPLDDGSSFDRSIRPYGSSYVLADFAEVTEDFGRVFSKVNEEFGTELDGSPVTSPESEQMFRLLDGGVLLKMTRLEDRVARPSEAPRERKLRIAQRLSMDKLSVADALYREYVLVNLGATESALP